MKNARAGSDLNFVPPMEGEAGDPDAVSDHDLDEGEESEAGSNRSEAASDDGDDDDGDHDPLGGVHSNADSHASVPRRVTANEQNRAQLLCAGSPASREHCAAAYIALEARWHPPRLLMEEMAAMNRDLLFPLGNVAPTWSEARAIGSGPNLKRYYVLHLCPGPHKRSGGVACGYVYLPDDERLSCPDCKQYRLVQVGVHVGSPRLFGIVFDFDMIWQDKFATPGYSSQLNPTHGHPFSEEPDAKMERLWDSGIWRDKVTRCPVMSKDRRHPAF